MSSTQIGGWAWRSDIPNTPINVHLYIRKTTETTANIIGVTANGYRSDLANIGYGNGYHAFSYAMDWTTYTPGTYEVKAFAIGGNGINPQLSSSPKNFTVRAATGHVDVVRSDQIAGWAWKPDAPNSSIRVHIYIKRANGETVTSYSIASGNYRSDLQNNGYGNGNHGFVHAMDWSTLPEELLTVEVYAVDGSGHHPRIYVGTYENRKPIYLLGATDEEGTDYSDWMTSTVRDYCYDIGCSECIKWTGFNNNAAMSAIANSSVCVIHTHGGPDGISCYYQGEKTDLTSSMITNDTTRDYSTTRFVLLLACSCGGQTDDNSVNFVNALHNKGVQTVLGFSTEIFSVVVDAEIEELIIDQGACLWAQYFLEFLGQGYTIIAAYEDALGLVFEDCGETYGLENKVFAGNQNQIVKH